MDYNSQNLDGVRHINTPKIDIRTGDGLSQSRSNIQEVPRGRTKRKIALWICAILAIAGAGILGVRAFGFSSKVFVGEKSNFFKQISDVIRGSTGNLSVLGEKDGQINILLLGIGGQGHDGPYLSDTIMLAQIQLEQNRVSLTSIPRDYLASIKGYGDRKINAAFAEGYYKNKNWDEAGKLARETVEKLSGLTIPYFAVIDFSGFQKAIDQFGGIDIEVERTFTDYTYPDENNGYLPPVTFTKGQEHMSGRRALIFARSRHAGGEEGSDFARSQRQHKIIEATKQKVASLNLLTDIGTVNSLVKIFADHFHTNLSAGEILHIYTLTKDFPKENIATVSLDPSTSLVCPDIVENTGAYVIVPCPGKTVADIQSFFTHSFLIGRLAEEKAIIWIATEAPTGRVYKQTERKLSGLGTTVWPLQYSEVVPEQSAIYTVNSKPATVEYIKNILNAREVTLPPPGLKIDATRADIIIILGTNIKLDPLPPPAPPVKTKDVIPPPPTNASAKDTKQTEEATQPPPPTQPLNNEDDQTQPN